MYLRTGLDFKGPTPISYVVKQNSFPDAKEYDLHLSVTTIFGTTETTSTSICFKEGIIITHSPCWVFFTVIISYTIYLLICRYIFM